MYQVTIIGGIVNIVNASLKFFFGVWGHSYALIADGIHSLADTLSDGLVLVISFFSRQAPDHDHPYGHERIETIGSLILGAVLIAIAGGLIWDATYRMLNYLQGSGEFKMLRYEVIAIALLSILSKEWLYHYTKKVALKERSKLLLVNAWHHRVDALSSIVVVLGIIAVYFKIYWADAMASAIIGLFIARVGLMTIWESILELVDTALPTERVEQIKKAAQTVPGVLNAHDLKTRTMGPKALLDIHILVDGKISVSEGHKIGLHVSEFLKANFQELEIINFHIDPAKSGQQQQKLPLRETIEQAAQECCPLAQDEYQILIHYQHNQVHLDIYLKDVDTYPSSDIAQLEETWQQNLEQYTWFSHLKIWKRPT